MMFVLSVFLALLCKGTLAKERRLRGSIHADEDGQQVSQSLLGTMWECDEACSMMDSCKSFAFCEGTCYLNNHSFGQADSYHDKSNCTTYYRDEPNEAGMRIKRVMIVTDMQNDYRNQSGMDEILRTIPMLKQQRKVDGSFLFDLIVYTKDWLDAGKGFCVKGTPGSSIIDEVAPLPNENYWIHTKDTDDSMTVLDAASGKNQTVGDLVATYRFPSVLVQTKLSFDRERRFAIDPVVDGVGTPLPLSARLASHGYKPTNTHIYFVGTQTNRCVMKGAIHAKQFGFDVTIIDGAVAGGSEEKWIPKKCPEGVLACEVGPSFSVPVAECRPAPGNAVCTDAALGEWRKDVYEGYHGGPAPEEVPLYLKTAGVHFTKVGDILKQ
jgi:nicotinamidase-related amidase